MNSSKIEWTEKTWNPSTGCLKISEGCRYCYAETMAKRLQAMGHSKYRDGFQVRIHPDTLKEPLKWRKPQLVFVNSMSDLFHDEIPTEYILRVFDVMREAKQHTFQVLTKRAERLRKLDSVIDWPENVWMGVSVENQDNVHRIEALRQTGAAVKFLSIEPLIGPLSEFDMSDIDWVIVGGESGPKSRPIKVGWVRDIRDRCVAAQVSFFFKQWGGRNKKANGRILDGKIWDESPV